MTIAVIILASIQILFAFYIKINNFLSFMVFKVLPITLSVIVILVALGIIEIVPLNY